jgi:hypothetical protein
MSEAMEKIYYTIGPLGSTEQEKISEYTFSPHAKLYGKKI